MSKLGTANLFDVYKGVKNETEQNLKFMKNNERYIYKKIKVKSKKSNVRQLTAGKNKNKIKSLRTDLKVINN